MDRIPNLHWYLSTTLNMNTNFNDKTVTFADEYGLHLIDAWQSFKTHQKRWNNNIFKIRFVEIHKLKLNISFSISKGVIKHYLKCLSRITKIMITMGITLLEYTIDNLIPKIVIRRKGLLELSLDLHEIQ